MTDIGRIYLSGAALYYIAHIGFPFTVGGLFIRQVHPAFAFQEARHPLVEVGALHHPVI